MTASFTEIVLIGNIIFHQGEWKDHISGGRYLQQTTWQDEYNIEFDIGPTILCMFAKSQLNFKLWSSE